MSVPTSVEDFIRDYGSALASGEGEGIARYYDSHVLFASDAASFATANDPGFASWFSSTSATYRDRGFGDPVGELCRNEPLSDGKTSVSSSAPSWP